ncbi:unnamed protein product [Mytilus edulis]|uniref:Coiled-coil domain-containing protein 84 n=1 Tax=Mytilus edulis TaxID=6550 RepID=A0A8S3R3L4_MYTED|nr:unnamed protein product [Mytilus edulis]
MDLRHQFQYCSFCKISHKQKKKHVYSKKHQSIIMRILQKFSEKVKSAKSTLDRPDLQDTGFEIGAKFWCYFCVDEFDKHLQLDTCIVKFGGLLEHITLDTHRTSVYMFLRQHRLDEEKQQAAQFLMSQDALIKFKEATVLKLRKYEERKRKTLKMDSKHIEEEETRRKMMCHEFMSEPQLDRNNKTSSRSNEPRSVPNVQRKATLSAHGEGLTFIGTQNLGAAEDNVHTDALPPWLQGEGDTHNRSEIGPTIEDYNKHLEKEKSRKLPEGRVGAKFDRSGSLSSQWLPSFGRVWNTGRRQQSEIFFRKELGMSNTTADVHNKYDVSEEKTINKTELPVNIRPYVKKKRVCETVTNNEMERQSNFELRPHHHSYPNTNNGMERQSNFDLQNHHHSYQATGTHIQPYIRKNMISDGTMNNLPNNNCNMPNIHNFQNSGHNTVGQPGQGVPWYGGNNEHQFYNFIEQNRTDIPMNYNTMSNCRPPSSTASMPYTQ